MSKITLDSGIDKIPKSEDQLTAISKMFDQIKKVINNGLGFADNFDGKIVSVTFLASDTNTSVSHGLGRVPSGYVVLTRSASMIVYDGSTGNTASLLILRSSATGSANIFIF